MRRTAWAVLGLACVALLAGGCEPPNHVDASPDGSTMYFSFGVLARWGIGQGSQLYSFDIENCRLKCLSDNPCMNTWVTASPDGSKFSYTRCLSQSDFNVFVQGMGAAEPKKLGEVYNAYGASQYIPGDGWLVAVEGRALADMRWVAFDPSGNAHALGVDKDLKALGTDTLGLDKNRCVVACWGLIPEYWKTNRKPYGIRVYVVDFSGAEPKTTLAALFDCQYHEIPMNFVESVSMDFAFSPDGKKIVASWYSLTKTSFYELDASGKETPKLLFSDAKAHRPQYMSDGAGVAYLREHPDPVKWNVMQLMLKRPGQDAPAEIAQMPGRIRDCGTAFRRLADGRLRAMHLSNDGIAIIQCNADGSKATSCTIASDKLEKQRQLARFEYVFKQNPVINQWQAPYDVVKFVPVPTAAGAKREEDVAKALEKAYEETRAWKSVAGATPAAVATTTTPTPAPIPAPVPAPSVPTPPIPAPSIETPSIPTPPVPSVPSIPPVPALPAPTVEPPKPVPAPSTSTDVQRGRLVKCPHCGQTFFLADDK